MNELDRELREALHRKQPSADFADRVLRRVEPARRPMRWLPAAIAAGLLVAVSGAYWERQRQAEQAKEQLMQALQITAQKIALVEGLAAKNLRTQE